MSGVFLIAVGSVVLLHNVLGVLGVSPVRVGARALEWYGAYWPLLLIAWGAYKVYLRFHRPGASHVSAAEIVILTWILVAGLAVRGAQHAMSELEVHLSAEEIASFLGPDLLGPPHRAVERASFELAGTSVLVVENRLGRVTILGSNENALDVTLTKQIHRFSEQDAERALREVELEFRAGDEARLTTTIGQDRQPSLATDLEIRVPRAVSVRVDNERGAVRLEGLDAPARVSTTHGNVEVARLGAGVDARTSHATIRLEAIAGPVVARNEHGAIHASGVSGDVVAEAEHSSIAVEDITGNLSAATEHGAVRVMGVGGSVDIESPYSEVSVERAEKTVTIASSHRPVFVHDVGGRLQVKSRYARVVVRGVSADVSVENLNRPVSVAGVRGTVSVSGEKCEVGVDGVDGAVTIATSHEDIRVSDFGAGLDIRASDADVEVRAARMEGSVHIETSRGDVNVVLPADVSARVSARTRRGELLSELGGVLERHDDPDARRWEGNLGSGAHPLTIVTSYGDIALERASR